MDPSKKQDQLPRDLALPRPTASGPGPALPTDSTRASGPGSAMPASSAQASGSGFALPSGFVQAPAPGFAPSGDFEQVPGAPFALPASSGAMQPVDSENALASMENRAIATNQLLRCVESTRSDADKYKIRISERATKLQQAEADTLETEKKITFLEESLRAMQQQPFGAQQVPAERENLLKRIEVLQKKAKRSKTLARKHQLDFAAALRKSFVKSNANSKLRKELSKLHHTIEGLKVDKTELGMTSEMQKQQLAELEGELKATNEKMAELQKELSSNRMKEVVKSGSAISQPPREAGPSNEVQRLEHELEIIKTQTAQILTLIGSKSTATTQQPETSNEALVLEEYVAENQKLKEENSRLCEEKELLEGSLGFQEQTFRMQEKRYKAQNDKLREENKRLTEEKERFEESQKLLEECIRENEKQYRHDVKQLQVVINRLRDEAAVLQDNNRALRQAVAEKTAAGEETAAVARKLLPRPRPRRETSASAESLLARLAGGSTRTPATQGLEPSTSVGTSSQSNEDVKTKASPTKKRKQEEQGGEAKRARPEVQETEPPRDEVCGSLLERVSHGNPEKNHKELQALRDWLEKDKHVVTKHFLSDLEKFYADINSCSNPLAEVGGEIEEPEFFGMTDGYFIECPSSVDIREKNMMWFLYAYVETYKEGLLQTFIEWADERAFDYIKNEQVTIACRFVRLLAVLLCKSKQMPAMRKLCYDIARWTPQRQCFSLLLLNVCMFNREALLWKDEPDATTLGENMVLKAIQSASAQADRVAEEIYIPLAKYCNWPPIKDSPSLLERIEEFKTVLGWPEFKALATENPTAFEHLRFNLVKALEIAFFKLDNWHETYTKFLREKVEPLLTDDVLADVGLELMGSLGGCGLAVKDGTSYDETGVQVIRDMLLNVLAMGNNGTLDDFKLQVTAAQSLFWLADEKKEHLLPIINWYRNAKDEYRSLITRELHAALKGRS